MALSSVTWRHRNGADHADLQDFVSDLHLALIDSQVAHDMLCLAGDQDAIGDAVQGIVVAVRRRAFGKRLFEQRLNRRFEIAPEGIPGDLDQLCDAQIGVKALRSR